jgi:hypothetical protein
MPGRLRRIVLFFLTMFLLFSVLPVGAQDIDPDRVSTLPPGDLPLEVWVDLYNVNIDSIEERTQTFEVEAFLTAAWFDERQAFAGGETRVYQGETAVELLKTTVWHPDFEIIDARGPRETLHITLTVDPDGFITLTERFRAFIVQPFDLYDFPLDAHEISFTVAPFYYNNEEVTFLSANEERATFTWETNEWLIADVQVIIDDGTADAAIYPGFASTTLQMIISRIPQFYITNVFLPLLLIVAISWAVFWMDFRSMHLADRLSVSFTSVLTVVAFDFVTADDLPQLPYQTLLDRAITFSYIVLSLSVLENVLSYLRHRRSEEDVTRIDQVSRWLFPVVYYAGLLLIVVVI